MLIGNGIAPAREVGGRVLHGSHAAGQKVWCPARGGQGADRVCEIRGRVLMLAIEEGIDDGSGGILVPDAEAADSFDGIEILLAWDIERLPGPRGEMKLRADHLRGCRAERRGTH